MNAAGSVFADGVICVGGLVKRLAVKAAVQGIAQFPGAGLGVAAHLGTRVAKGEMTWG